MHIAGPPGTQCNSSCLSGLHSQGARPPYRRKRYIELQLILPDVEAQGREALKRIARREIRGSGDGQP
jgi:hypothetical protein